MAVRYSTKESARVARLQFFSQWNIGKEFASERFKDIRLDLQALSAFGEEISMEHVICAKSWQPTRRSAIFDGRVPSASEDVG
jgi:hypothetical protein